MKFYKKAIYFVLGVAFSLPLLAQAIGITVPSAPGSGYGLISTTTGAYIATSTGVVVCSGSASCGSGSYVFGNPLTITASGGSTFPFTPFANYNATSTAIGFLNGLFSTASSTFNSNVFFPNLTAGLAFIGTNGIHSTVATSTLTASSPLTGSFTQIGSGGSLGIQAASASQNGYLSAAGFSLLNAATTTFTSPLIYTQSTNAVTCQTADTSHAGCLTSTDWNTFNGKVGFAWPFTPTTNYNVTMSATSTPLWARLAIFASSTSYFDQINVGSSTSSTMSTSTFFGNAVVKGNATSTSMVVSSLGSGGTTNACALASGLLTITGCNNGTVTSIVAGTGLSGGTISGSGTVSLLSYLATSSAETAGQIPYWTTSAGTPARLGGIATSSAICSGFITCTGFTVIGSGAPTITVTGALGIANGGTATTTFYNGGVVFYNSTLGTLSQPSATNGLFWDNTNSRLGIGTASPGQQLDIVGSTPIARLLGSATGQFSGPILLLQGPNSTGGGAETAISQQVSDVGGINGSFVINQQNSAGSFIATLFKADYAASTTQLFSNGSARVTLDASGNVGVGTSTPGSLLSINGIANFTTATTTFYGNGINIPATKCYAVGGTCLALGGSVTSITAGTGLSGGTITNTGNISLLSYLATSSDETVNFVPAWNTTNGTPAKLTGGDASFIHLPGAAVGIGTSTPWAQLSVSTSTASSPLTSLFAIASSTNATLFSINGAGAITLSEDLPATTTTIVLDWSREPTQVDYQIGTAATTITIINATTSQYVGTAKRIEVCNPGATAGALTWKGAEWYGGTTPTQTTTANVCDQWAFHVTAGTSTSANRTYKVFGGANTGAQ